MKKEINIFYQIELNEDEYNTYLIENDFKIDESIKDFINQEFRTLIGSVKKENLDIDFIEKKLNEVLKNQFNDTIVSTLKVTRI